MFDFRQAFQQQPMRPDSRHITSTYTPLGIFQWKVNIMALKNAGIQFQHLMEDLLEPVKDVANCYIDDIIIGTPLVEGEDVFWRMTGICAG